MPIDPQQQLGIREAMILIAGVAVGLWLFADSIKQLPSNDPDDWLVVPVAVLGGISLAGAPVLLVDRSKRQRRWRSGAFMWLAVSAGCWGLAPAIALARLRTPSTQMAPPGTMASVCFVYTLPLMALFLLAACAVAGRPAAGWVRCRGWWPEWFGMWMLVGWSCVGLYVLVRIYMDLFR